MSKMIKVDCEKFKNLLRCSSEALELLDAVHCYDTEVYENLKSAVDALALNEVNEQWQTN